MEDERKPVCREKCSLNARCLDLIERANKKAEAEKLAGKTVAERRLVCRLGPTISGQGPAGTPVGDGFDCHAQVIDSQSIVEITAEAAGEQRQSRFRRLVSSLNLVN